MHIQGEGCLSDRTGVDRIDANDDPEVSARRIMRILTRGPFDLKVK